MRLARYIINNPIKCLLYISILSSILNYINTIQMQSESGKNRFEEIPTNPDFSIPEGKYLQQQLINISAQSSEPAWITTDARDPLKVQHYQVYREENGYFARGDTRSPEALNWTIKPGCPPRCEPGRDSPHYDVVKHRQSTFGSGLVSTTDDMGVARYFGQGYSKNAKPDSPNWPHYIFFVKAETSFWINNSDWEREHTAVGAVDIVSSRKCQNHKENKTISCGNIFIIKGLEPELHKAILKSQHLLDEQPGLLTSGAARRTPLLHNTLILRLFDLINSLFNRMLEICGYYCSHFSLSRPNYYITRYLTFFKTPSINQVTSSLQHSSTAAPS